MNGGACPACGSTATSRIRYGLVVEGGLDEDDVVGGCVVGADGFEPDRRCRDCGHAWRDGAVALLWPDPRAHVDGDVVEVGGTVGRVVLEATTRDDAWATFDLVVEEGLPRLACVAFPTSFAVLDVALEPGLDVRLRGRIAVKAAGGPELHVTEWLSTTG